MPELASPNNPCPICDATARQAVLNSGGWCVDRCRECGMVYLSNPPAYDRLTNEFAWSSSYQGQRQSRRAREPFLHAIQDVIRPIRDRFRPDRLSDLFKAFQMTGQILDLGCGSGRHLLTRS